MKILLLSCVIAIGAGCAGTRDRANPPPLRPVESTEARGDARAALDAAGTALEAIRASDLGSADRERLQLARELKDRGDAAFEGGRYSAATKLGSKARVLAEDIAASLADG